jgi:hypothetical protein
LRLFKNAKSVSVSRGIKKQKQATSGAFKFKNDVWFWYIVAPPSIVELIYEVNVSPITIKIEHKLTTVMPIMPIPFERRSPST